MWAIVAMLVLIGLVCGVSLLLRNYRKSVTAFEPENPKKAGRYESAIKRFHAAQKASRARFERQRRARKTGRGRDSAAEK